MMNKRIITEDGYPAEEGTGLERNEKSGFTAMIMRFFPCWIKKNASYYFLIVLFAFGTPINAFCFTGDSIAKDEIGKVKWIKGKTSIDTNSSQGSKTTRNTDLPGNEGSSTLENAEREYINISESEIPDLNGYFNEQKQTEVPGCAVAVYFNGATIYSTSYGMANLDYGIPISDSTRFYMASISKQFTSAAAALLIIRGEVNMESRVATYLKDWPDWAHDVRVKHLFNHTSGLPDIYELMDIAGISLSNVMNLDDYMSVIRNGESLKHRPGAQYSYTNSGFTVLAKLVETVAGENFSVFVDKELFQPLEMTETHFHDDRYRVIPNRAISYAPMRKMINQNEESGPGAVEVMEDGSIFRQTYRSNFQGVGPGGLYSSLRDWGKWEAFWNGKKELRDPIEAEKLKRLLTERVIINGDKLTYGKGLEISNWQGVRMEGHAGGFMGFKSDVRRFPEYGLAVLTLCNRQDSDPAQYNRNLARRLLKEPFEAYLKPYSGIYHNSELQVDYTISVVDGTLSLGRRLYPNGLMDEEKRDKWQVESWDIVFIRDTTGSIKGFNLTSDRAREVEFLRK